MSMLLPYSSKNNNLHSSEKGDEKKDKNFLMKKILIKNKIVSILSHQPRKLMKLAKKGSLGYKNLQQHSLLPKLTLNNLYPQIQELNAKNRQIHSKFQSVNQELTFSMLQFQNRFTKISQQQQGKILQMQTKKCFNNIPNYFFQELSQEKVNEILTKNKNQAIQQSFQMTDYQDQVQFNINQQVQYRMKLFIDFASFLKGIADLVDISCKKINGTRTKNNIIREIVIEKSTNINILRIKQQNLAKTIQILEQIKKVKNMQKGLMSLIHAKGKMTIASAYQQYCKQHEKIRQYCCKKNLCNFGDIRYYVQRNYHDAFNKSLQNYICELIKIDRHKLLDILKPRKANYMTSPFQNRNLMQKNIQTPGVSLDQSIEIDDGFQLVIKTNIQKEITNIFEFGLDKCTYSTDSLCLIMKQQLQQLELAVYSSILQNSEKPKEDLIGNFVNYALNRPSQNSLQLNIHDKILSNVQKSQIVNKITLTKFLQIAQILSQKLMDLNIRCFSIINQLMRILHPLSKQQPEKEEIVCAYLIQLVIIAINFSDSCFGSFIDLRQIKQNEIQMADKLIKICQGWEDFIEQAEEKYDVLWKKLAFHFNQMPQFKQENDKKQSSFKQLQQFVKLNYSTKQMVELDDQCIQDVSQDLIDKKAMKLHLLHHIMRAKNQTINFNFNVLSKVTINKQLIKRIQNETWLPISMNSNIQNSTGFILYGRQYLLRQEKLNNSRNFLSKSLLLQKSYLGKNRPSEELIPPPLQEQFQIETTQSYIKIKDRIFRLIGSSQYIIETLHLFFLYFDNYSFEQENLSFHKQNKENLHQRSFHGQKMQSGLVITKSLQLIMVLATKIKYYVNNLKDLQKKVKSFAKFLLLVFVQLQFFKTLVLDLLKDNKRFQNSWNKDIQKQVNQTKKNFIKYMDQTINEVIKKYNSISYQKIKESIKKLQINPKKQIKVPSETTGEILTYFSKSLSLIDSIIIDKRHFWKFLDCPWIKQYLQKVNEQSSQLRKYVLKSNGSGGGRKIQDISWEAKLEWKQKQIEYLLMQIQAQNYTQHIKDLYLIDNELKKEKQTNTL